MSDRTHQKLGELMDLQIEAQVKGWAVPRHPDPFGMDTWERYWRSCQRHEQDPSTGRPVVPHRSGRYARPPRCTT